MCDAATNFNLSIKTNGLVPVLCNDHARRKLVEAIRGLPSKDRVKAWAAAKGVAFYKLLYRIEREISEYSPELQLRHRHERAVPVWEQFIDWATKIAQEGLAHGSSREALKYLLKHEQGLRRYCEDGRLPISNILAEHVAKKVAIARKNFLFADTPAGAKSTAMNYCLIETARTNGHNAFQYMAVVIDALPSAVSLGDYETLLPWNVTSSSGCGARRRIGRRRPVRARRRIRRSCAMRRADHCACRPRPCAPVYYTEEMPSRRSPQDQLR